jgi:hypothetical protein
MTSAGLQKYFDGVDRLHAHHFFKQTGLREDLEAGKVFPAIRKNEVHFYHGGARLCVYKGKHMYTNNRYLGIWDVKSRDVRIPEDWFSPARYEALKKTCKEWRDQEKELSIVSELFPAFSVAGSDGNRLLDIECRFPAAAEPADVKPQKAQDMIDCLFLTSEGTLVFVEVKRTANEAARGSGASEKMSAIRTRPSVS